MNLSIDHKLWREQAQEDDAVARLVWAHVSEAASPKVHEAVRSLGPAQALRHAIDAPRAYEGVARRWHTLNLPQQLDMGARWGVRYVQPGDAEWPAALDDLREPPHCLFVRGGGNLESLATRSVAIVGARAATSYGQRVAAQLGCDLGTAGYATVSGGAFGIDAAAHRGALIESAGTVCVLAGGVDRIYPQAHTEMFATIAEQGVLVSESPMDAAPMRQRFLHRNRLIAALAPATVVVEAGLRSGSLSTARRAAELNRIVAAVPGAVTSAASAGCHELIRDHAAVLVTDAGDVLELVRGYGSGLAPRPEKTSQVLPQDELSARAALVWDVLPLNRSDFAEDIATAACISLADVMAALGELQLCGLAVRDGSGWRKTRLRSSGTESATLAAAVELDEAGVPDP